MASKIAEEWVHATVQVFSELGGGGTGFLVAREDPNNPKQTKVAVVTNKHVLHKEEARRSAMTSIGLGFNIQQDDGPIAAQTFWWPMRTKGGELLWREHPDPDTDVLVVNISGLIAGHEGDLLIMWVDYNSFADANKLAEHEVSVGDEVVILGYPTGLSQGQTNLPLVRQGIISTQLGLPIIDAVDDGKGGARKRNRRGFLVDGGVIPGSSGSPVVLKPISGRVVGNSIQLGTPPAMLLGIISETHIAEFETEEGIQEALAGLGMAFDADTVRETMDLLFD